MSHITQSKVSQNTLARTQLNSKWKPEYTLQLWVGRAGMHANFTCQRGGWLLPAQRFDSSEWLMSATQLGM